MLTQLVAFQGGFATGFGAGLKVKIDVMHCVAHWLMIWQAGKWGSKSYATSYKAGYAAGVLREQTKELHAQQMMQVTVALVHFCYFTAFPMCMNCDCCNPTTP
jgi:hypothetical protein